jgi:ATP-dependent helicase HrpB
MLPIDAVLPQLCAVLAARTRAVLVAPPGAGKTTRVPLALMGQVFPAGGKIILLSPRRIAARAAAARMAASLGEEVGARVGYRVRLETKVSRATRIEVVTEGVFTRMILDDPALEGVAAVLFDEFHERSLEGDLGLALACDAQTGLREDLRIVVMSATLEASRIAAALEGAPVIVSEGRLHPVEERYLGRTPHGRIEDDMARAVRQALREEAGSILAFLPGAGEIRRCAERLAEAGLPANVDVRPLFGAMEGSEQDAAIAPSPAGRRKVVLATDIAETSLTIEGVRVVIDAGLARRPRYEPGVGLTRLETVRASQASLVQRKGRAGRLEPGAVWRLWDAGETRAFPAVDRPEIQEADLTGFALDLARWGLADPSGLVFLDPPPAAAFAEARATLAALGALDGDGRLTEHGRAIASFGLSPRLAHMVLAAAEADEAPLAARIAALVSEPGLGGRDVDLRHRLAHFAHEEGPRAKAARAMTAGWARAAGNAAGAVDPERAGAVLALAFPDRLAKARGGGSGAFLMANGRAAAIDETDALAREPFLVIADATGKADRARILAAAPISLAEIEALFAGRIETRDEAEIDGGAVRARRRTRLGAIVLSEAPLARPSAESLAAALLDHLRRVGLDALPWDDAARQMRARIGLMRGIEGEARWPDFSDAALRDEIEIWLGPALLGVDRLSSLEGRLADLLLARLPHQDRRRLAEEAPTHFETPAGSHLPIDYACEGAPALDVRLQELFGMARHPAVAGGRAPLLLRLLSPAHRPVQTTRDLPGFWRGSYAAVRADMRGRYPKHPWPDDPLAAAPTRRAKPRG